MMLVPNPHLPLFVWLILTVSTALRGQEAQIPVSFRETIAPLLLAQCQGCHGVETAKGDYRVDSYTELMRTADGELPRVRPGQPKASLLLQCYYLLKSLFQYVEF